ncbi:hypothetical protein F2E52_22775 [Salmonella enterica]|nr:hypothetical protein [Salmonella enterica]
MTIELQLYSMLVIASLFFTFKAIVSRKKTWAFVSANNAEMTKKYNNKFFIYTVVGIFSWFITVLATSSM